MQKSLLLVASTKIWWDGIIMDQSRPLSTQLYSPKPSLTLRTIHQIIWSTFWMANFRCPWFSSAVYDPIDYPKRTDWDSPTRVTIPHRYTSKLYLRTDYPFDAGSSLEPHFACSGNDTFEVPDLAVGTAKLTPKDALTEEVKRKESCWWQ